MQTTEILRTEVKFRFIDYLKAAQIPYYEPSLTVCPHCGQHAQVVGDFLWNCPNCGSKGDVVDYAMESHGFRKTADALKHVCRVLGVKICSLDTIAAEELMDMQFPDNPELIEGLLGKGLYLLAGASKIGKCWLVLWLARWVSLGQRVWDVNARRGGVLWVRGQSWPVLWRAHCVRLGLPVGELKTRQRGVLSLSLEDTDQRLQRRLVEVTGGETGDLTIATDAELLGSGLEEQLTNFLSDHPETKFVIIDTLQKIRQLKADSYSYAGDYATLTVLKQIADRFDLTILLVHHTRKQEADDAVDKISGTTGLIGCADGSLILEKENRLGTQASLTDTSHGAFGSPSENQFLAASEAQHAGAKAQRQNQRAVRTPRHPLLRASGGKCEVSDSRKSVRYFRYVRYFRHPTRRLIIAPIAHTARRFDTSPKNSAKLHRYILYKTICHAVQSG